MERELLILLVIGIVLVIAAVQSFQIIGLSNAMQGVGNANTASLQTAGSSSSPPASATPAGQMVGGC